MDQALGDQEEVARARFERRTSIRELDPEPTAQRDDDRVVPVVVVAVITPQYRKG